MEPFHFLRLVLVSFGIELIERIVSCNWYSYHRREVMAVSFVVLNHLQPKRNNPNPFPNLPEQHVQPSSSRPTVNMT